MSELTKWPRLLVTGPPITPEQAGEILIRTCVPACLGGNDRDWYTQVCLALGLRSESPPHELYAADRGDERIAWFREARTHNDRRSEELGILGLEYLRTSRIASSWFGGPHGWCDWDGTIGCSTYNIGKWPTVEELTAEWTAIASAFPYLELTAQVVPEVEGEFQAPAAQWIVAEGRAEQTEPRGTITEPTELTEGQIVDRFLSPYAERGVSIERLVEAVRRLGAR